MKQKRKIMYGLAGLILFLVLVYVITKYPLSIQNDEKKEVVVQGIHLDKNALDSEVKKTTLFREWMKKEHISDDDLKNPGDSAAEKLIEQTLAKQFAQKQEIIISDDEIQAHYQKAAASIGGEEKYLAKLKEIYGMDKKEVVDMISYDLLKQKIAQKTGLPFDVWIKEVKETVLKK